VNKTFYINLFANQAQDVQLYIYIGWAAVDCVVTASFVSLLYKSMAGLGKARWHLMALGVRSLAIVVLAIIGILHKSRLRREAQADVVMALSVCFLVVRAFKSMVFSAQAKTFVYPGYGSQKEERGGGPTKGSLGYVQSPPSTSSQQHIVGFGERYGSDDGDIELDVMSARAGSRSAERFDTSR
jgi:hypothetical protein